MQISNREKGKKCCHLFVWVKMPLRYLRKSDNRYFLLRLAEFFSLEPLLPKCKQTRSSSIT